MKFRNCTKSGKANAEIFSALARNLLHSPEIGTDVLDWKRWVFLLYSPEIGTDILNWKRRVCPNIPI
jgi:hypothetical protein